MAQVTLYLDEATEALLAAAVARSGLSRSRWVAQAIQRQAADAWPQGFRELAGAFPDFPLRNAAADATLPDDAPRLGF